mgnify:CR=1 FL=1
MNKEYKITQTQLDDISYFKNMFEYHSGVIKWLCESEKDDVVYGFRLGETYTHMRECYVKMMELESQIRKQNE